MLKVVVTAQDEESCRSLDGRQPKYMWDGMSCERRPVRPDGIPSEVGTVESLAQTQHTGKWIPSS